MDEMISGEHRESLIRINLKNASIYIEKGVLTGLYLPDLGEGLILALNPVAGNALMDLKYATADKAVLPTENKAGNHFLKENGFVVSDQTGKRMIYGKDLLWKPECLYSRVGGNLG
jgi:hypothetical protein